MKRSFLILIKIAGFLAFFTSSLAQASEQSFVGLVQINQKKLYVEYTKPTGNKPTLIFLNGLTYSTKNWIGVTSRLRLDGYGILSYDPYGMGTTLLSNPLPTGPILYSKQVEDLHTLLENLHIPKPYNFVGLSYGGGILAAYATHYPRDIQNLILINPYTEFLESQKEWLKEQVANTRFMFPNNPATDEQLIDYFIRELVYTTYPLAEISSLENPYKLEGITRLVQGIRMYQPIQEASHIPKGTLHLVISEQDQYIPQDIYAKYWKAVPDASKASLTYVKYSEHKLPEAFPRFTYQLLKGILDRQPLLFQGNVLEADPVTMKINKKRN